MSFYVDKLAEGIAQIAAAFAPEPVIVRLSDFKSNEYANLIGGKNYEPHEENPMLGFRGRVALHRQGVPPLFRTRMPRAEAGARRDGPDQRPGHGAFRAHLRRGEGRHAAARRERPEARRQRPQAHHDVRTADQRAAGRSIPRILRRHVDRLERHDAAGARSRPRLGRDRKDPSTSATMRSRR